MENDHVPQRHFAELFAADKWLETINNTVELKRRWYAFEPGGAFAALLAERDEARAQRERLAEALSYIAIIGGNLPDEHLTDRTGPNDARARGLMYCEARRIARAELESED